MIAYTRVSTAEQAASGAGLSAQRQIIAAEAAHRGWDVTWLCDTASGKDMKRPQLQIALGMLAAGDADGLVVAKLDRLSRSVVDFANTLTTARRQGWAIVLLDLAVDTTTPNGKFVAGLMTQIAEWERDIIGERTRDALDARRAAGVRLGRPQETSADAEAIITRLAADGKGARTIASALSAQGVSAPRGGTVWHPSTVARILARTDTKTREDVA